MPGSSGRKTGSVRGLVPAEEEAGEAEAFIPEQAVSIAVIAEALMPETPVHEPAMREATVAETVAVKAAIAEAAVVIEAPVAEPLFADMVRAEFLIAKTVGGAVVAVTAIPHRMQQIVRACIDVDAGEIRDAERCSLC